MLRLSKARLAFVVAPVTVLAVVGAGIAAWSTNGSGTAYAKAATAGAVTLSDASASTTGDLYPGGSGALKVKVTNPNTFPVQITAVTGDGSITSDAGAACTAGHGVTLADQTGLSLSLAAGATTVFSLAGAVSMSMSSVNSCQGAVFSIPVTVTAANA
jgi:hypothetical protein